MLDVECPVYTDIINSYLRVIIPDLIEVHATVSQRILFSTPFFSSVTKTVSHYFSQERDLYVPLCIISISSHIFLVRDNTIIKGVSYISVKTIKLTRGHSWGH